LFNVHFTSITSPTSKFESNSSFFQRKTWPVFTTHIPLLPFCSGIPADKVTTTAPAANVSAAVAASAAYVSWAVATTYLT